MKILKMPDFTRPDRCSYLEGKIQRFNYFYASDVSRKELDILLERGWRKFGIYYFRPVCEDCRDCIPLRIPVDKFKPSKSQRRIIRKNAAVSVSFSPLLFSEEIYEIYRDHSLNRFNRETSVNEFIQSFYMTSCHSMQSEFYYESELFAVGYLDISNRALSSVYFIYKTKYTGFKPGIFSIIKEITHASELDLKYYYPGYYIEENPAMSYKNSFQLNEKMSWETGEWMLLDKK